MCSNNVSVPPRGKKSNRRLDPIPTKAYKGDHSVGPKSIKGKDANSSLSK